MSTPAEAAPTVDWHDEEVAQLFTELGEVRDTLGAKLTEDVQREDVVIGGPAVQSWINRDPPTWYVGALPEADVKLEYWATHGDQLVRIAKERRDGGTRNAVGLLAKEVRGRVWTRRSAQRRTERVAELADAVPTLMVSTYDLPDPLDDDAFIRLRYGARVYKEEDRVQLGLRGTLYVNDELFRPIDKEDVLEAGYGLAQSAKGWEHIFKHRAAAENSEHPDPEPSQAIGILAQSFRIQAEYEPTQEEIVSNAQRWHERRVNELRTAAAALRNALEVVREGKRVRPSEPQHTVDF